ncbi:MAG: hypothetical protein V4623_10775 [Pseudomonadota bacterium]
MIGVPVPPTYPEIDSNRQDAAALIEWFYEDGVQTSVLGGRFMQSMIDGFDTKKGTQHNFESIMALSEMRDDSDWLASWAKGLIFDALIGNTDRHQNNWALLFRSEPGFRPASLAPWFDNGTSLGCERHERQVSRWHNEQLMRYLHNGRHHMRWDKSSAQRCGFFEMPQRLIELESSLRGPMLGCVDSLNLDTLAALLTACTETESYTRLTPWRADFMHRLVEHRKEILLGILS